MNKKRLITFSISCVVIFTIACIISVCLAPHTLAYPPSRKDSTVDTYHGVLVADPYRWLEDATSPETLHWTEQQNKVTEQYLAAIPIREKIRTRLTELWNYPKYSAPQKRGARYFFWKNDGLQNHMVLYALKNLKDEPTEIINPNTMSADGTTAVSSCFPSHDGTLIAYALSYHGSDWKEVKIHTVDGGKHYNDVIKWCKFTSIAWHHNNSGFYYNRFAQDGSPANAVYWHRLGTPQDQDLMIFEYPGDNTVTVCPTITEDGNYLEIQANKGTSTNNAIYYRKIESHDPCTKLFADDAKHICVGNIGSTFYFLTDKDAPRGRIIAVDASQNSLPLKEIIPQQADTLSSAEIMNQQLVCCYMHDAYDQLKIYSHDGTFIRNIPLPTMGSIHSYHGKQNESELFIGFASFLYPSTIFRYDFNTNALTELYKPSLNIDFSLYQTKQVFYSSKDGTKVPMFIIHKKDINLDGKNPTLVYAYGGFEQCVTPYFAVSTMNWLEHGGVMAVANIRGGGEYGAAWHETAILEKRQNAFDDFIAAAEWLIKNNYTQSSKLASMGGSNGGLLVATCMNQQPELFGAVICQVPVTDMLRYPKFTSGCYWVPEYGDAEKSLDTFKYLYAYSPLHNVKPHTVYPPLLVTTADTDDRVAPLHAKKFIATLQAARTGNNPLLLRTDMKAGHGAGKPTSKQIAERTDIFTFLFHVFGMN